MRRFPGRFLVAGASAAGTVASTAGAQAPVWYEVDLERAAEQVIGVTLVIADTEPGPLAVHLPVWRPGLYRFVDAAGSVRTFEPTGVDGSALEWSKTRRSSWVVESPGGEVRVSYELVAASLGNRTRHADRTHAFMSGSSVFMYADAVRDEPLEVRISLPTWAPEWTVATGLDPVGEDPPVLHAPSYDLLVDSPIDVGEHEVIEFDRLGAAHELVTWGGPIGGAVATGEEVATDIALIVEAQAEIFGGLPYERYVFITHVGEGLGGGTEHWNSTVLSVHPEVFDDETRYERFLGLVAHEVFHTWNVKRLRPAALSPYEYQRESLTDLLWVAEGTTSYYDELTLPRADVADVEDFVEWVGDAIDGTIDRSGWDVQSLADASRDAWIKQFVSSPDARNSRVSIYNEGAVASMSLDLLIRKRSESDLDSVMRAMYERFPLEGGGYTTEDLLETIKDVTGVDTYGFFADHIAGKALIDFPPLLAHVGLELSRGEAPDGVRLGFGERRGLVAWVEAGSPAAQAGLNPGDEVVAINGRRYGAGGLSDLAEQLAEGEMVEVSFFRFGRLQTAEFIPEPARGAWEVTPVEEPTKDQAAAFRDWTGQRLPDAD